MRLVTASLVGAGVLLIAYGGLVMSTDVKDPDDEDRDGSIGE